MAYGLAILVFLAALAGSGAIGYAKGSASRNAEVSDLQSAIQTSESLAKAAALRAEKTAGIVRADYARKLAAIRSETPTTQIIEVIKRETPADCVAPGAFRLLHDSAAAGSAIAQGAGIPDAAPASIADVAATVAENYARARENAAQLEALQSYLKANE